MTKANTGRRPTILIVDDDPTMRKLIRVSLQGTHCTVLEAENGRSAIEMAVGHKLDLVLLDLGLPDVDGLEVARHFCTPQGEARLPIILLSGFLTKLDIALRSQLDFADYLLKPVEPTRLLEVVQTHLPASIRCDVTNVSGPASILSDVANESGPATDINQGLASNRRRVLVAHDDPLQLKLLKVHLEKMGFQVVTSENGADALTQARYSSPDAIVSDVLMPNLDGFELCQAVRSDPHLAYVPVILVSVACTEEADRCLAETVGADMLVRATPDFGEVKRALMVRLDQGPTGPMGLQVGVPRYDPSNAMDRGVPRYDPSNAMYRDGPTGEPLKEEHTHSMIRRLEHQATLNVHLVQRLAYLEAQLVVLAGFAERLANTLQNNQEIESAIDDLLRRCLDASGASHGAGYLRGPDGQFSLRAQIGYSSRSAKSLLALLDHTSLLKQARAANGPFVLSSSEFSHKVIRQWMGDIPQGTLGQPENQPMLVVPLRLGTDLLGLLMFSWTSSNLEEDWFIFINALQGQISQSIALAQALAQLRESKERSTQSLAREEAARIEAETSDRTIRAIIDAMPAGVLVANANGEVVLCNEMAKNILGGLVTGTAHTPEGRCTSRGIDDPPTSFEELPLPNAIKRGETTKGTEIFVSWQDGTEKVVLASGGPVNDAAGRTIATVTVFQDITERKRIEQLRQEYVSLVSHDLRNPLTSLTGYAQLLARSLPQKELYREAAFAEAIVNIAKRMNSMIQDLVESSSLEAGQLEMSKEPTDLTRLVSDIAGRIGPIEDQGRIRVETCERGPTAAVDPIRLERAITNLIGNALKYSPTEKPVTVTVARGDGDNEAIISVTDQGIGISQEDLPHLFQRFYRAKSGKQTGGLGLGLYIARLIVEAHGGRVWGESAPGKGSSFYVALPIA